MKVDSRTAQTNPDRQPALEAGPRNQDPKNKRRLRVGVCPCAISLDRCGTGWCAVVAGPGPDLPTWRAWILSGRDRAQPPFLGALSAIARSVWVTGLQHLRNGPFPATWPASTSTQAAPVTVPRYLAPDAPARRAGPAPAMAARSKEWRTKAVRRTRYRPARSALGADRPGRG